MSDPTDGRFDTPPPESLPSKSASPLLWLVVLAALMALGWYFYNQHATRTTQSSAPAAEEPDATPPGPPAERPASPTVKSGGTAAKTKPVRAPGINRDARPVAPIQPQYPPQAVRNRVEGTVLVRVEVDADGRATNVEVVNRSSSLDLDRAATDAVRKWRFKPALKDGQAIASTVDVPVEFKLDRQ